MGEYTEADAIIAAIMGEIDPFEQAIIPFPEVLAAIRLAQNEEKEAKELIEQAESLRTRGKYELALESYEIASLQLMRALDIHRIAGSKDFPMTDDYHIRR